VIIISAFELIGTYNGSAIQQGLQNLQNMLNGIKAPVISPTIAGGSGNTILGGLQKELTSGAGNFAKIGETVGQNFTNGMTSQFGMLGNVAGSVASALGPVGIAAGVAGAAVIGLAASSVGVASGFQSSMSKVSSVLGGGQAEFDKLSNAAREAGATTTYSASQAADGLYFLASAGYTTDETISALGSTLNLAGAGGMDLARSAELLTTDIAVFGLKASDATNVTDLLATAAKKSNTGVAQMGEALAGVGGTAHGAGISMKDTVSVLEVMANNGLKASEAGTKYNAMLGVLTQASGTTATQNQTNALKEMGITADQLNPTLHSQAEIWGLLAEKHMNSAQALAIFGIQNQSAAQALVANSGDINKFAADLENCGGAAGEMNKQMNANLGGAQAQLSSAIEEMQISIGNLLLPSLTAITNGFTGIVTGATQFGQAIGGAITSTSAFGKLSEIAGTIGSTFTTVISTIVGSLSRIGTALNSALGGNALGSLLNALTTPFSVALGLISAIVSLIGSGVVAGFQAVSEVVETIIDALQTASAYLQAFGEVTGISKAFGDANQLIGDMISKISDIGSKISSGLSSAIPTVISALSDIASQFGDLVSRSLVSGISDIAGALGLGDVVESLSNAFGEVSDRADEILTPKIQDAVKDGTTDGMEAGSEAAKDKVESDLKDAAKSAGEEFAKSNDAYIKSHSSGGYSLQTMQFMSSQQSNANGPAYLYAYKDRLLDETEHALLQNYSVIQSKIKTDQGGYLKIVNDAGEVVKSLYSSTDVGLKELENGMIDAVKPAFLDMPKYMRGVKSEMSSALAGILSDGVVEFTEKDQLTEYIKQLDALRIESPVEFDAKGLDKIREDLVKTAAGIPLTLDMGKVEANFALWLTGKKDLFEKIFAITKQIPLEEEQRVRQKWELNNQGTDALNWLTLMTEAATSGDVGALSAAWDYKVALEELNPELINQKWYYQLLQTLQTEFADQVKITNGNLAVLDDNGKALGGTFIITDNAAKILSPAFLEVAASARSAAISFNSSAGQLSSAANQWVQSRIYDTKQNTAYGGSYTLSANTIFSGFNNAQPATTSDFGGLLSGKLGFNIPALAEGGKVTKGGLALIGEAGTEYVIPEKSLTGAQTTGFYPATQHTPEADAWNALYDNTGTCVAFAQPDPSLKFTPPGSVPSSNYVTVYDANGNPVAFAEASGQNFAGASGTSARSASSSISVSDNGALVVGKSVNGYIVSYDPRTDTCEGLPFNAPDPSLKTTDPFYLGLTKNSPAYRSVEEDGWGGVVAQALTPELAAKQEQYQQQLRESEKTTSNTQQIATSTSQTVTGLSSLGTSLSGALVSLGGGSSQYYATSGSNIIGLANRGGGDYWGGTSINGGGSWIGGGASLTGIGAQASNILRTTGSYSNGSFSASGGSGSYQLPAIFRARGGLIDHPELAIVGEAGTEMILPPHLTQAVMNMAGGGGGSAKNITVNYSPIINGAGLSADEVSALLEKDHQQLIKEITEAAKGF